MREAETNALINLGYDCSHAADSAKAAGSFEKAGAVLETDVWSQWLFQIRLLAGLATHHLAQGELEKTEGYARRLFEFAGRYECRKYMAIANKLLAEAAIARDDLQAAESHVNTALNQLADYPVPIVEWKLFFLLGEVRVRMHQQSARQAFGRACSIVQAVGESVQEEALRASFLGSGAVQKVLSSQVIFQSA